MKKLVTLFVCALIALSTTAQNRLMAEMEFESAEKAFSSGRYEEALRSLDKAQEYAGQWLPAISYLRIVSDEKLGKLDEPEIDRYLEYANSNPDKINRDQFREVYAVKQKIMTWVDYMEGMRLYDSGNYFQSFEKLKVAAENGWENAMFRLGELCGGRWGIGSSPVSDRVKALEWWEKAAEKGIVEAMYNVGLCYAGRMLGDYGVQKNIPKGVEWLKKAADKGHANSMYTLGWLYYWGEGVTENKDEGIRLIRLAADNGSSYAKDFFK